MRSLVMPASGPYGADPNAVAERANNYLDGAAAAARLQHGTLSPQRLIELTSAS